MEPDRGVMLACPGGSRRCIKPPARGGGGGALVNAFLKLSALNGGSGRPAGPTRPHGSIDAHIIP